MKFDIHLTEEDYIAFNIFHRFHSPRSRKYLLFFRLLWFVVSILFLLVLLITGAKPSQIWPEAVILLGLSAFFYFRYPGSVKQGIRRQIEKIKAEGKLPYNAEETIEFTDDQIVGVTDHSENRWQYSDIVKICADEEHIFLYTGAVQTIVLPLRCLGEEKDALLSLLRDKTGKDIMK